MPSAIYAIPVSLENTPVSQDTDILSSDITIAANQVSPSGGGILRISFSFVFNAATQAQVAAFNNNNFLGYFISPANDTNI